MVALEQAFEQHRRELHVHCYRMLASYDDAEDAVQECFLRAWSARDGFDGDNARAWLYRIATNVCLDRSRARQRRVAAGTEVSWLTPYPDTVLDQVPADDAKPEQAYVARETIELAFLAHSRCCRPGSVQRSWHARCSDCRRPRPRGCSRPAWRRPTVPCNAPARRCATTCRRTAATGRPPSPTSRRSGCSTRSSTLTSGATPRRPWPWRPPTCGSPCRPTRGCTTDWWRSVPCSSAPSAQTGRETGDCCRPG